MEDSIKNAADDNANTETIKPGSSDRVKRMRGWLGIKSNAPSRGHADDNGGPLLYGDGHSGWNR